MGIDGESRSDQNKDESLESGKDDKEYIRDDKDKVPVIKINNADCVPTEQERITKGDNDDSLDGEKGTEANSSDFINKNSP